MRRKVQKCSWERFLDSKHGIIDHQDTISRLPDAVQHHILSFLPSAERDQIRFLSRNWRRLHAQTLKTFSLSGRRLNEQQVLKILEDDFPSTEFLALKKCPGMRKLRMVNDKLNTVELNYCRGLKNLDLVAPNLENFHFLGPRLNPCKIELGICKELTRVYLSGVSMNSVMFGDCSTSFPVLQELTLKCCDMTGDIKISSNSLQMLSLLSFNMTLDIVIDAPNLNSFWYDSMTITSFSNMNLPHLAQANIKLRPSRYQKRDETWFSRLSEMLQGLKHTSRLMIDTNSVKNIIVPKELRESLVPPVDGIRSIFVKTNCRSSNCVDLVDAMLWMCPRVKLLVINTYYWVFYVQFRHEEGLLVDNSCCFCTTHPSRCWRHSMRDFQILIGTHKYREQLVSYIRNNLKMVRSSAIGYDGTMVEGN